MTSLHNACIGGLQIYMDHWQRTSLHGISVAFREMEVHILRHKEDTAFQGDAPISLINVLNQLQRWIIGALQDAFSNFGPLTYGIISVGPPSHGPCLHVLLLLASFVYFHHRKCLPPHGLGVFTKHILL